MIRAFTFRISLVLAVILLCSYSAHAQDPLGASMTLRVTGLTSETRDAIARELKASSDARLVFACVPAGLMVFSSPRPDTAQLRSAVSDQVSRAAAGRTTEEMNIGLSEAEELCAQARNR